MQPKKDTKSPPCSLCQYEAELLHPHGEDPQTKLFTQYLLHNSESHRAGQRSSQSHPLGKGIGETTPMKDELSNKIICQEDRSGMCHFQTYREKGVQKKFNRKQEWRGNKETKTKYGKQKQKSYHRSNFKYINVINESKWAESLLKDKISQCFFHLIHIYATYERNI